MRFTAWFYVAAVLTAALGDTERTLPARSEAIAWQRDYETAAAEAQSTGRPLLVVVTAHWCPACVRLDRTTFLDPSVVELINRSLVAVRVDADSVPELTKRLGAQRYPVTMVLSPTGTVQGQIEGYQPADKFALELNRLLQRLPQYSSPSVARATPRVRTSAMIGGSLHNTPRVAVELSTPEEYAGEQPGNIVLASHLNSNLALGGYCVVSLVETKRLVMGEPELHTTYAGQAFRFAGKEELEKFRTNPGRYTPVLGGLCVTSRVRDGRQVPGDPHFAAIFRRQLYLFAGPEERSEFQYRARAYADQIAELSASHATFHLGPAGRAEPPPRQTGHSRPISVILQQPEIPR